MNPQRSLVSLLAATLLLAGIAGASVPATAESQPSASIHLPLIQGKGAPALPDSLGGGGQTVLQNQQAASAIQAYRKALTQTLQESWATPEGYLGHQPVLLLVVTKKGDLASTRVLRSSDSVDLDAKALEMVRFKAPFAPLPSEFPDAEAALTVYLGKLDDDKADVNTGFQTYLQAFDQTVRHNWHPPMDMKSKKVVLFITLDKSGQLKQVTVKESSGFPDADKAAIQAVETAAPYATLPPTYKKDLLDVELTFGYQAQEYKATRFYNVNPFRYRY